MARRTRTEFPGAIYHVYQRGNNREPIFEQEHFRQYFFQLLASSRQELQLQLFAYVIMSNHFHLLLRIGEVPLQRIMHNINTRFSMHYNYCQERTGHVFEGRYGAELVTDDRYLLTVLRYIHLNPVRAGLVTDGRCYPWSSYQAYLGDGDGITDTLLTLSMLAEDLVQGRALFNELMQGDEPADYNFGEQNEATALYKRVQEERKVEELERTFLATGATLDDLKEIRLGKRTPQLQAVKSTFVQTAKDKPFSIAELADFMQASKTSIHKLSKR